ncbi:ACT domain-containing protein [Candidatus Woesearchaeota archaeon]|nr:ACT domain-containing protein [Candidatus Woesearchaeota archaeon]
MNITKLTEKYICERPSIRDCIRKGLVNYSALSRQIGHDLGIKKFDAILIACRRYAAKKKGEAGQEKAIINILKNSKIEIKDRIMAVVMEKGLYHNSLIDLEKEIKKKRETLHIIEGANTVTIITGSEFLETIKKQFSREIIKINNGLTQIIVKSPQEIEETPGVIAYLYSVFGDRGINIVESMSCWTDTLFVVNEKDAAKALEALKQ